MSPRITFKKGKRRDGRSRLPKTFSVNREGSQIATLQESEGEWFWYGDGMNTYGQKMTFEECKSHCVGHFKVIDQPLQPQP